MKIGKIGCEYGKLGTNTGIEKTKSLIERMSESKRSILNRFPFFVDARCPKG